MINESNFNKERYETIGMLWDTNICRIKLDAIIRSLAENLSPNKWSNDKLISKISLSYKVQKVNLSAIRNIV